MRSRCQLLPALLLTLPLTAGCKKEPAAGAPPASSPMPALPDAGPTHAATPNSPGAGAVTGKVLEKIDAAGYSYLRVAQAGGDAWAAVPESKGTAVGSEVTIQVQMVMPTFESTALKRRFDKLIFGTLGGSAHGAPGQDPHAGVAGAPPLGGGAPKGGDPHAGVPGVGAPAAEVGDVKVPKATGDGAHTVAEVWAAKEQLKGQKVVVRGKVVKFTPGVLGHNWIHLRDGTGNAAAKDDDLTFTTDDTTAVGEVVTVAGTVQTGRDFGLGYRYPVIVEGAKLTK